MDASPAAVAALPEPGLTLRARRDAAKPSWLWCVIHVQLLYNDCCPDHPTSPCMGRKGQRSLEDGSVLTLRGA